MRMTEWQPIETAPKDETEFLGYHGPNVCCPDVSVYKIEKKKFLEYADGFWVEQYKKPTHWMPMPKPPKGYKK